MWGRIVWSICFGEYYTISAGTSATRFHQNHQKEIWEMEEVDLEKQHINHITPEILKTFQKNNAYLQRHTTQKIACYQLIPCP